MSNQLLEAALEYAKQGWPIFPCSATKEPLIDGGVTMATTDAAKIRQWWERFPRANIGLDAGGAGFMVFDFDPGSDKAAFAKTIGGEAPETGLRARTPRGGDHWYYQLGDGETVPMFTAKNQKRGEPKFSAHVDVRSFHSYVLLPPSRTADGVYEWASYGKPAHRTDEMYRVAHLDHRERSSEHDTWIIDADMGENVAAAVEWLKHKAEPAVKGSGGNNAAYGAAAMCKSYGLSAPTAFEVLWAHWGPRCTPQWYSPESLEKVIEHAYEYNTSPPGNMTTAYKAAKSRELFKPVVVELPKGGAERRAGRFRFVDRGGMANIQPPSWLVKDMLPEQAYAMLVGAPGTYKSFIALDIALSIATGKGPLWEVVGCDPATWPAPAVLYCAGEGRPGLANRVKAWELKHNGGEPVGNFILADPVPNVNEDWAEFIEGARSMAALYRLIIIDTVGRAMQGANENSQEHASKLTARAEQLTREFGCTVLALHHVGHGNDSRGKGSMEFIGAPDTVLSLTKAEGLAAHLRVTKQKDGEEWKVPKAIKLEEVQISEGVRSLVPVSLAEARTVKTQEELCARSYAADFLIAFANAAREKDGTVLWANVRATMCGMNEEQAQNAPAYTKVLTTWFGKTNPLRIRYDTGARGPNNAISLREPKE